MLTPIDDVPIVAGTTPKADKQIAAEGSSNNTVVYTVPAGRKFVGWASNTNNGSYWANLESGGVAVRHYGTFSASPTTNRYEENSVLTLLAGTTVKVGNGQTVYVFGVESDA